MWILSLECPVKTQKWKILLITGNFSAHKKVPRNAKTAQCVSLLLNCTSIMRPPDQRIINAANLHYDSLLMLPTFQCVMTQTQIFWKLSRCSVLLQLWAACTKPAGAVPQDECNSDSDVFMVKNWQHLCQKLNVQAILDVFICVKNNAAIVAAEVTGDDTLLQILTERNGRSGNDVISEDDHKKWWKCHYCYESIQHGATSSALCNDQERCPEPCTGHQKMLQEITDKSILKWAVLKILPNFCTKLTW